MHVELQAWAANSIQRERGQSSSDQAGMVWRKSCTQKRGHFIPFQDVLHSFSTNCLQMFLWKHSLLSLPRGPYTLKDPSFLHGVELLDGVVLLVEVSVGLFPGLRHRVLEEKSHFSTQGFLIHPSRFIVHQKLSDRLCVFASTFGRCLYSRVHSVTLKAMAATSDRLKAMGRWNLRRLASNPLITGLGRDMMAHNLD